MASKFTPTSAELALANQIFVQADTQKVGILTGDVAVKVFGGAKLSPTILGEIWGIADDDNNGFLTRKGVTIAVRLMGWAQKGEKVSQALINKPGPLPTIEGVQAPLVPQGTGMSIPKSPPPGLPVLTPQDKVKFNGLFQNCGPVKGLLSGEKARDVFVKSKLPLDKLSQIWALCDTQDRGSLDSADFTIAMYLIQAAMSGQLSFIPTTLPPGLYEQAGGAAGVVAHATGSSAHLSSPGTSAFPQTFKPPPVQAQYTGQSSSAPALPSRRPGPAGHVPTGPPFPSVSSQISGHWDVSPAEKASADRLFDTLDPHKRGFIEGDVAVPFMLRSKLSEDVLAHVWDLADINNDGRLTRDGFAVVMHLIQGKLSGKEIPATLPPTLVPPSMRSENAPFIPAAFQPPELVRDLLWDDSPPSSAVTSQPQSGVLQPQTTGAQALGMTPAPPPVSTRSPQVEDPFSVSAHSSFNKDLLSDDDDTHGSPPLHDQSAEIGNVQNQLNSTNKSLSNTKAGREALETTLANQAAQLAALQTQLASAKASFETETALLNTLRERHATQIAEMQKVREELIRAESDLSAVRVEKAEIEGSFLRDKEEVRDLNRKMAEATSQIGAVKQEVEKVKKDAKQQKGLLAIARKQLATKESEKAKADKELEEAQEDLASTIKEQEEAEAEVEKMALPLTDIARTKSPVDSLAFAAAQPLPVTPDVTGPMSPTSVKSNNPFERLAISSGASTPRSQSPFRSFSNAPLSTPPGLSSPPGLAVSSTVAGATPDDPFGFVHASESEPSKQTEDVPNTDAVDLGTVTPRATLPGDFGDMVSSPINDEQFSTPPNTIAPLNQASESVHVPSFDTTAAHFPAIEDIAERSPQGATEKETDLSTDLHELEAEESDSDSDEDSGEQDHKDEKAPVNGASAPSTEPISFDDIFGATNDVSEENPTGGSAPQTDDDPPTQNGTSAVDAFGAPLTKPANPVDVTQDAGFPIGKVTDDAAGKADFKALDEAFGKLPSSNSAQATSNFTFDSAFEDNFDFGSTTGPTSVLPPPPSATTPANGNAAPSKSSETNANGMPDAFSQPPSGLPKAATTQAAASFSFDDAFSSSPWTNQTTAPPEKAQTDQSMMAGITFEEAFGGLDTSQALKLDNSFSSRSSKAFASPSDSGKVFPSVSPATSPRGPSSPRVTSIRSSSPQPRATSPSPRAASPKMQRPSTSSSKEAAQVAHEKPPPPPRHSKLSIRLPFGKKKKQDSTPPVPSSHLAQQHLTPVEEPGFTSAAGDDAESVKQLAAMGFSRDQAVAALEAHDYNVRRALNGLLGSQ
ncbi:hypothetical protein F5I97DRAFT_615298 [Phlebopus sp. FC_14]|nr:hypothetical protein F5I97DRAFT_615298 [Phlebopus sp. FC_14]